MKPLRLEKHNPKWASEFTKIKDHLDALIASFYIDILHIGSTSVSDLYAKPIIDITIVFDSHLDLIISKLEASNYQYEGFKGIPERHAFAYLGSDLHEHHLYACHVDSAPLKDYLDLKRNLLNHPKNRARYSTLKQQLIAKNKTDRELYTISKTNVIQSILLEERTMRTIVFAGGCFWGVEAYFKQLKGVLETEVGYIAGNGETSYKEVCAGSGHAEAVMIQFDEELISLKKLLDHLFNIIDPTSINKQGPDVGVQYRSGVYNYLPEQLPFIKNYIAVRQKEYTKPIVIELGTNLPFFQAEDYHQDYLEKNKNGYCHVDLTSHKNIT